MRITNFNRYGLGSTLAVVGVAGVLLATSSCGTAPTPFIVSGSGSVGNEPPSLTFLEPVVDITRGQGDAFLIRWSDSDPDNNAKISFALTANGVSIPLVGGIDEDEALGPNQFRVPTTFVSPGSYNLVATISDGVNAPVVVSALLEGSSATIPVVITIVGPGEGPQTVPPQVEVIEPTFPRSVAQDDVLTITIRPTEEEPDASRLYDPDSDTVVTIALDTDLNAEESDLANPGLSGLIILGERSLGQGEFQENSFDVPIDVSTIPPLPGGASYFIRATIDDGENPPVHSYAAGSIAVVTLAAGGETGVVDLFDIGRTKSGARFQGFNPAANLGSKVVGISDFDADGTDDFLVIAQFGNPQNVGPVGEAYLIYGLPQGRFGGTISANTIADTIPGTVFYAPPVRPFAILPFGAARTDGIADAAIVPDLSGDGRPELLFGLPHVHGAYDSTDYDPSDSVAFDDPDVNQVGCYPDNLVNNRSTSIPTRDSAGFYAGGMAVMVNSSNRDNSDANGIVADRLTNTVVSLELAGQLGATLDGTGLSGVGNIRVRADNSVDGINRGTDPQEPGRTAGARFVAGGFDNVDAFGIGQPPRDGLYGSSVASLGDITSDGVDEIVISAPRNERYINDLVLNFGLGGTHWNSTAYRGSITIFPGANFNSEFWRELQSDAGTCRSPALDNDRFNTGECPPNLSPRVQFIPLEVSEVFAEDIDDWLGDAGSAGDFNQDGRDDLLCGAPRNDRNTTTLDTGATYIIYSRAPFGSVDLRNADDPVLRAPMLRIRGLTVGDQIGWRQTSGLDVNNDGIDDVFIASPKTDFGGIERTTCAGTALPLTLSEFNRCRNNEGDQVFHGPADTCSDFDYDNDGDIDDDDECVFCCLSGECNVDPSCVQGRGLNCCDGMVDNGFVGIIYGGVNVDGDRTIEQLATSQLAGVRFYGASSGDQAGFDVNSAGDYNEDGFGDLLVVAPGVEWTDSAGRVRRGVVYLIFGGSHLNTPRPGKVAGEWNLNEVGTADLPGIVFVSPFVIGRPNEASPKSAASIGDINNDGFGDISIGIPDADFIDPSFPQGPNALSGDAAIGRRSNVGNAYIIYGSNFGSNRVSP